jgi:flagellar biosynthesis/type III secretory pathway M-ring protein FliF/YscJ
MIWSARSSMALSKRARALLGRIFWGTFSANPQAVLGLVCAAIAIIIVALMFYNGCGDH